MKRSIIFRNIPTSVAMQNGIEKVAIPIYEKGQEIFNKIKGDYEVKINQYRNLKFHNKLFGIIENIICNEFFEKLIDRWSYIQIAFNIQLLITEIAIQSIRITFNDDVYSLIYICKYLFLPMEKKILPNGKIIYDVSSISFKEMDNVVFEEFYNKSLDLIAFILDLNKNQLENY